MRYNKNKYRHIQTDKYCKKCRQPINIEMTHKNGESFLTYSCRCGEARGHLPSISTKEHELKMKLFSYIIDKVENLHSKIYQDKDGYISFIDNNGKEQKFEFNKLEICKPYISFFKEKVKICFRLTDINGESKIIFLDASKKVTHNFNISTCEHKLTIDDITVLIDYSA